MKSLVFRIEVLVAVFTLLLPDLTERCLSSLINPQRPIYRLMFVVNYTADPPVFERSTQTDTNLAVSQKCGEYYATTLLTNFIQLNTYLSSLCPHTDVRIGSMAVVYILVRVVKVETTVNLSVNNESGSGNISIVRCSETLNNTLQDVTSLDRHLGRNLTISSIHGSETCSRAIMNPVRFHLQSCDWICGEHYQYNKDRWECYKDDANYFTTQPNFGPTSRRRSKTTPTSIHLSASSHLDSSISSRVSTSFHAAVSPVTASPGTTTELDYPDPKFWGIETLKNVSRIHLTEGVKDFHLQVRLWYNETAICQDRPVCEISMTVSIEADKNHPHPELDCRRTGQSIPQVAISWAPPVPKTSEDNFCRLRFPPNQTVIDAAHLVMQAVIDHKYDKSQMRWLHLSLVRKTATDSVREKLLEIPIWIEDMDKKATCQSINDPHITTFDGLEYNNFYEGEFILYQHKTLPFKVHAIYQKCHPNLNASCNCGVAVQSGDDVIVIDRCFRRKLPVPSYRSRWQSENGPSMKIQLLLNGNLTQGTRIHEDADGKKYFVFLPHGAYVKMIASGQLVNLWIVPSPNDRYLTEGLCGVYDWNRENDFQLRNGTALEDLEVMNMTDKRRPQPATFIHDWGVEMGTEDSLFGGVPPASEPYEPRKYCICEGDGKKPLCDYAADISHCDVYQGRDVTSMLVGQAIRLPASAHSRRRVHRDINDNSVLTGFDDKEPVIIDKKFVPPPKYKWQNSWNEVIATNFCRMHVKDNYRIGKLCSQIPSVNFKQEITTCIEDIKITGNTSWADSARDAMKEQCIEEVQKNGSLPLDIVRQISSEMCINDCSDHGICINGTCHCNADYGSADCSIPRRSSPYVNEMPRYGLCDVRYMNCSRVIVYGGNFLDSINLTCHLQKCKMTDRTYEPLDSIVMLKATFINFNAVECPIPSVHVYLIRISNNGLNTSEPLLFIPFDSACNSCNVFNTTCFKRRNSCIIDGRCYREGDLSPVDGCLVCKAYDDEFQWTTTTDGSCYRSWWETFHMPDWAVALGAAVGGSLIGILTGFLLYRCCLCSKKSVTDDDPVTDSHFDVGDCSGFETDAFLHRNHRLPTFPGNPFADIDNSEPELQDPPALFYNDGGGVENGVDSTTYF